VAVIRKQESPYEIVVKKLVGRGGGETLKRLRGKWEGNTKCNLRNTVTRRGTIFT
jgi:hypothetical protein